VPKDIHLDISESKLFVIINLGMIMKSKLFGITGTMENRHERTGYSFVMVGVWYILQSVIVISQSEM
jgi:hypothetical protein